MDAFQRYHLALQREFASEAIADHIAARVAPSPRHAGDESDSAEDYEPRHGSHVE